MPPTISHKNLIQSLKKSIKGDLFWEELIKPLDKNILPEYSVHIAIFVQPYLDFILDGLKTIESRFSAVRCAPYGKVKPGDIILLKLSGGPILGICRIKGTWFYRLDPNSWKIIRDEFKKALCAEDPGFWKIREKASYATFMQIENVRSINPIPWKKRDRRGWVIVKNGNKETLIEGVMTNLVLAFSGEIGSGKTEISKSVAGKLKCPRVSFGDYVRAVTRLRGLEDTREKWQDVGESLIKENIKGFCSSVLAQVSWEPGQSLVIDGIRHLEVIQVLKELIKPSEFCLIYISLDSKTRKKRLDQKKVNEQFIKKLDGHSTEIQVKEDLRSMADFIVDGSKSIKINSDQIISWVKGK